MVLFSVLVLSQELHLALDDEEHGFALFIGLYDLRIGLVVFFLEVKLDLLVEFLAVDDVSEVVDLLKHGELELLPGVIVLKGFFLHLDQDVREAVADVLEHALVDAGHRAVVRADH